MNLRLTVADLDMGADNLTETIVFCMIVFSLGFGWGIVLGLNDV